MKTQIERHFVIHRYKDFQNLREKDWWTISMERNVCFASIYKSNSALLVITASENITM